MGIQINTASEIVSDAGTASHPTENAVVFSTENINIDENIFDIDLTEIENIPEITQSKKNPQFNTISVSQPVFHKSGTYNMASASAIPKLIPKIKHIPNIH